jgi:pimeloyl-ACP methyl ester carboxylesterase
MKRSFSPLKLLWIAAAAAGAFLCTQWADSASAKPAPLAETACPIGLGPVMKDRLRCMLFERSMRSASPGSTRVQIMVMRIRAESPDAKAHPLLFIMGGAGASSVPLKRQPALMAGLARHRDVILFDHRGAGLSRPAFACPGQDNAESLVNAPTAERKRCALALRAAGLDPNAFGPDEAAQDIAALRKVLRIVEWDVYGVSYGTTVAQRLVAHDARAIRSLILDSTTAGDSTAWDPALKIDPLLDLFDDCAANARCAKAFSRLDTDLDRAIARLHGVALQQFATQIYSALESPERGQVPRAIHLAALGDLSAWRALAPPPNPNPNASVAGAPQAPSLTYLSSICRNEWSRHASKTLLAPRRSDHTALIGVTALGAEGDWPGFCQDFGFAHSPATQTALIKSAIPTLILLGESDMTTPSSWALRALQGFAHAKLVRFPATGHFVARAQPDCAITLIDAFLAKPAASLPMSCVDALPRTHWTADDDDKQNPPLN